MDRCKEIEKKSKTKSEQTIFVKFLHILKI